MLQRDEMTLGGSGHMQNFHQFKKHDKTTGAAFAVSDVTSSCVCT